MAKWQDEIRARAAEFFAQTTEAFRFLETDYGYTPVAQKLLYLNDYRDTYAEVTYAGERMGAQVSWGVSSGYLDVTFRTIKYPRYFPNSLSQEEQATSHPVFLSLYGLARCQGAAQDTDFLLGDLWNLYESKCEKRNALLASNLRGVLDGLARATVRYGDAVLRGDSSQFSAVKDYYEAHKDDYILPRYRPQPKQPPTAQ